MKRAKRLLLHFVLIVIALFLMMSCSEPNDPPPPAGDFTIGTIGPGGGYIFYDKGSYSDGWRYLEAAPASTEFMAEWGLYNIPCPGTSTDIGTGKANTAVILNLLNANGETGKAAQLCNALTINGHSDWFLPSKDELNEMYLKLCVGGNIGEFTIDENWEEGEEWCEGWYLSSSVNYGSGEEGYSRYSTWYLFFSIGLMYSPNYFDDANYSTNRSIEYSVRGIRAF